VFDQIMSLQPSLMFVSKSEPTLVQHPSVYPLTGLLGLTDGKHSSLFARSVGDEEKKTVL